MRRLISYCLLSVVLCPLLGYAQQKPKENAQVLVNVRYRAYDVPTNALLYFRLYGGITGETDRINGAWNGAGTGVFTDPGAMQVLMNPNRHYQAVMSAGVWQYSEVMFSAPAGYSVWINDRPATTFRATNNAGTLVFKIELRPDNDASFLPAGMAVAPRVGDLIWQISAGRYSNGLPAGSVQWRASALSADLLNPTSLSYMEPDSAETATAWHSDGALLELRTFQFLLYVRRNTTPGTGYDIEIYSPYATRTGTGDGPYTYDETPFRTYRVSNPNGSTWNNQIRIEKIEDTTETWTISESGANWTVVETNSLRTITRTSTGSAPRVETVEVKDNANVVATKLQRKYQNFGWGQEEMIEETANPDAVNGPALTTTYAYHTTAGTGGYGRLKSVLSPDGSWVRYDYDDTAAGFGNLAAVYRPWQDGPTDPASATSTNCVATLLSYVGERNVFNDLPAGSETKILGTTTAKNTVSYSFPGNAPNGNPLRTETINTYTASGTYLTTTRQVYNPTASAAEFLGRFYSQTNPDGTKVSALRYKGYFFNYWDNNATNLHKWDPPVNTTWGEYRFSGFSTQVTDSVAVYSWDGESFSTVYMVPNRSTVQLSVFDDQGRVRFNVDYVFTGASGGVPTFELTGLKETAFAEGVPSLEHSHTGNWHQLMFMNGRKVWDINNDGGTIWNDRNAMGRVNNTQKTPVAASGEYPAQGDYATHYTYDASDRVLTERVSSDVSNTTNPADAVTTTRVYNAAGLLTTETAESGSGNFTTTYAYTNGGRTVTTTLPGGGTKIVNKWLDGSVKSVTGTAVVAEHHQATVNGDGTLTTATYALRSSDLAAPTAAPRWSKITTDWAGRTIKEERPAPPSASPSVFTKQYYYNTVGQLTKTTETALADALIAYNAWQQPYRTGLDLNANGTLDPASTDRITETDSVFEKDGAAAWWAKTTTKAYNVDNSGTPVTTSTAKTRLNKYTTTSGLILESHVQSESIATDIFGNTTRKTVAVERGTGSALRLVTETIDHPDSTTDEVTVSRNGLVQKHQTKEGLVYRTYYDERGRPLKTTDPRTDTSTTARIGYVANSDRIAWRQDTAGNQTNYAYNAFSWVYYEENPQAKRTYYGYNKRGQVTRTRGAATYPVEYAFNEYGEQVAQRTFRDTTADFTGAAWPLTDGGSDPYTPDPSLWTSGDKTTWAYDPAAGTLTSKTDAAGKHVDYTYTTRGQLKTRTWARGVTTTYAYSATTGEQTGIDYSDTTPDLTYTYNRLGQNLTVGDVTGTRSFVYSAATNQLTQEDLGTFMGTRSVAYQYDTTGTGTKGRLTVFGVGPTATPTSEYAISYGYDTSGRLNQVWNFSYAYAANSNLIASITDSGSGYLQTRTYESNRDLLDIIETKWSGASKAKFDYASDTLGRRTGVARTGEMFTRYSASGLDTAWGYNDRSELTSEVSKLGGTSTVLTGRNDAYSFDNIGNRAATAGATHNGNAAGYTANALNQYTQRTVPGIVDVAGLAPAAATVTVNGSSTGVTRHNDYYFKGLAVTNTSAADWQGITIASSLGGSTTRFSFTPQTAEVFTYDDDGNLLTDGQWSYTYDAENRLVSMRTRSTLSPAPVPNADARLIEFKNDYLGRRVRKTVYSGYNGTTFATTLSDTKSLYNGWNVIFELDALNSLAKVRSYIWGLDWSGTLQGAGGVGGLLVNYDWSSATWLMPAYDGNGNVMALLNRGNSGALAAAYEYDAFGNTLAAYGTSAASNPFRFSTKYTDTETGLVYYGLRYYSPTLGRFINKDPIAEKGGLNLYGFCGNNGINRWDLLGMDPSSEWTVESWCDWGSEYIKSLPKGTYGDMQGLFDAATKTFYYVGSAYRDTSEDPGDNPGAGILYGDAFSDSVYANQDVTAYLSGQNSLQTQADMEDNAAWVAHQIERSQNGGGSGLGSLVNYVGDLITGRDVPKGTVTFGDLTFINEPELTKVAPMPTVTGSRSQDIPASAFGTAYDTQQRYANRANSFSAVAADFAQYRDSFKLATDSAEVIAYLSVPGGSPVELAGGVGSLVSLARSALARRAATRAVQAMERRTLELLGRDGVDIAEYGQAGWDPDRVLPIVNSQGNVIGQTTWGRLPNGAVIDATGRVSSDMMEVQGGALGEVLKRN